MERFIFKNKIVQKIIIIMILFIMLTNLMPITVKAAKNDSDYTETSNFFSENITFSRQTFSEEGFLTYELYTPSSASTSGDIPLIVWLHGLNDGYADESLWLDRGLPSVLNTWNLKNFNAYVICPKLTKGGYWGNNKSSLQKLLDKFLAEHNVDKDNIILSGHSEGGNGVLFIASYMSEYFSKCVTLSPDNTKDLNLGKIRIPIIGYFEDR